MGALAVKAIEFANISIAFHTLPAFFSAV